MHDCVYKKLERDIREPDYIEYFKEIVFKQADDNLKAAISNSLELFSTLALSCGGNPRMLLRTIQDLPKFNATSVNEIIKSFYRSQIWAEHTELGEKYKGHKTLIDWGLDFIEQNAIPAIEGYNSNRKEKDVEESSIYFWVHKDCPETVKESLRLLSYTSVLRKLDSIYRASRGELGARYEVKYGCIISLFSTPSGESKNFFKSFSVKKFPEFGKNHIAFAGIKELSSVIDDEKNYKLSLKNMLQQPISVLQLLTPCQKEKLNEAGINTIEQLHLNTEESLIASIYNVGPVRARC